MVLNPNKVAGERFVVRRGKERELPKQKKPTVLKKVILQERKEYYLATLREKETPSTGTANKSGSVKKEVVEEEEKEKEVVEEVVEVEKKEEEEIVEEVEKEVVVAEEVEKTKDKEEMQYNLKDSLPEKLPKPPTVFPREYCIQVLNPVLDGMVKMLLAELKRFQDRLNPEKDAMKKRFITGLREVSRAVERRKIKCVILAPNIDHISSPGGLDEITSLLIRECKKQQIPLIFALKRRTLGRAIGKSIRISAVGILSYDGAEELFSDVLKLSKQALKE